MPVDVETLRELCLEAGLHLDGRPILELLLPAGLLLDVLAAEALAGVRARDLGLVALAIVLEAARPLAVAALVVPPLAVVGQPPDLKQKIVSHFQLIIKVHKHIKQAGLNAIRQENTSIFGHA